MLGILHHISPEATGRKPGAGKAYSGDVGSSKLSTLLNDKAHHHLTLNCVASEIGWNGLAGSLCYLLTGADYLQIQVSILSTCT